MTTSYSICSYRLLVVGVALFGVIAIRCSAERSEDSPSVPSDAQYDAGMVTTFDSALPILVPPLDVRVFQSDTGVSQPDAHSAQIDARRARPDAFQAQDGRFVVSTDDGGLDQTTDESFHECALVTLEAEQIEIVTEVFKQVTVSEPVTMYLMLDKSGSMSGEKWEQAKYAINKFIGATLSENINLALQYFPLPNGTQPCTGDEYAIPAVGPGRLPDSASAITRSMAQNQPGGGTPMEGGLRGLTMFCTEFKLDPIKNPDGEDCVGVLVSDGYPESCSSDISTLSGIAGDAYAGLAEVKTFTIGMTGADFTFLDAIAQASDSDCDLDGPGYACDISGGSSNDFLEALETIRDSVTETRVEERIEIETETLDCEWQIPDPPEREVFDRDRVNVTYSDNDQEELIIGRVQSVDDCSNQIGWYYDNPDDPKKIVACEETCNLIEEAVGAKIDIVLGCQTIVLIR